MTGRTPEREPAASATPAGATDVADDDLELEEIPEEDLKPDKDAVEAAIRELWREFKDTADPRLRERLILHYSPLVKYVAGRVGVGWSDFRCSENH